MHIMLIEFSIEPLPYEYEYYDGVFRFIIS